MKVFSLILAYICDYEICFSGRTYIGVGSFSNFFAILDALTGEKKFLEQFPDSIGNEASVSPCLNYLYFGCFDGNLYCINLESYKVAWNYKSENSIKCKPCFCPNNKSLVFGSYDKHIHCIKFEVSIFYINHQVLYFCIFF